MHYQVANVKGLDIRVKGEYSVDLLLNLKIK